MGPDYYKVTENLVKSSEINEDIEMKENFHRLDHQNNKIK